MKNTLGNAIKRSKILSVNEKCALLPLAKSCNSADTAALRQKV